MDSAGSLETDADNHGRRTGSPESLMVLGCTIPSWPEGQTGDFGLMPPLAPYGGIIPISLMQQP